MSGVEHILITSPDDPKIREILTRMSRFACNLQTNEDLAEKAYIIETGIPLVLTCYQPDKVTSEKFAYITPKEQRSGSRIFLTPGVIALVMFVQKTGIGEKSAKAATELFMDYFIKRIKGAYPDGNDVLIGGKKIMGIALHYNPITGTANIKFMLTCKSGQIKTLTKSGDFEDRKYSGITGVCDETGMNEDAIRGMVNGFVDIAIAWGRGK